jgi:hypothetical protein
MQDDNRLGCLHSGRNHFPLRCRFIPASSQIFPRQQILLFFFDIPPFSGTVFPAANNTWMGGL